MVGANFTRQVPPEQMDSFKQLFIGGCPRSGTTLLARLLMGLEGAVVPPESPFKDGLLSSNPDNPTERQQVARLHAHWQRATWNLPDLPEWPWPDKTAAELLEWLIRAHANRADGEVTWIDHTPNNLKLSRALAAHFPRARFVHMIRDPRGVFPSVRGLAWGRSAPTATARWWVEQVQTGRKAQAQLGNRCLTISFEELLAEPERTLANLCSWLDVPPPRSAAGPYQVPRYLGQQHALVNRPINPRRAQSWRHELDPREIELIESICAEQLDELGYERLFPDPRPATRLELSWDTAREIVCRGLIDPIRRRKWKTTVRSPPSCEP